MRVLSARMGSYVIHYILDEKAVVKVSIAQSFNSEEEIDKEKTLEQSLGHRSPTIGKAR